jgi:hypothetical protein
LAGYNEFMTRLLFAVFFLCLWFRTVTTPILSVVLEQQINLITQEFSTISSTDVPTDNSLGLIEWDGAKFNHETVYFEAIIKCDTCSGGNSQASVSLYNSGGVVVTGSTLTSTSSTYTLVRSNAITANLTNNTNYTTQLKLDATSGTAYLQAARLIVVQNNSRITDTRTHIEIGNTTYTSNQAREIINHPKRVSLDLTRFSPTPAIYFEATLKSTGGGAYAYAALSTAADCSSIVTDSEVASLGTSWERTRSNAISLSSNSVYHVCIKGEQGYDAHISNAKLILDQSNSLGITNLESNPF